jgi:hypothetical protein
MPLDPQAEALLQRMEQEGGLTCRNLHRRPRRA